MRHVLATLLLALVALVAPVSCKHAPRELSEVRSEPSDADSAPPTAATPGLRVLFIGNSHTYMNDMPATIQQLAAAAGQRPFEATLAVAGGAKLADHLADTKVRERLSAKPWDYVVLQEQQQVPTWRSPFLEQEFFAPARTWDVLIRAASSRTVLYMTPGRLDGDRPGVPDDTYERMQKRSEDNHQRIGRELDALVAPVGSAWAKAHRERPEMQLWAADRYHPSTIGSYLTACVFYCTLYGQAVQGNRYQGGLAPADATFLQNTAEATCNPR